MNAHLMHPDRDFCPKREDRPDNESLIRDLGLSSVLDAMADGDDFLRDTARFALLSGIQNDVSTVTYRQAALQDCLRNASVVRAMFSLSTEGPRALRRVRPGFFSRHPGGVLFEAIEHLTAFLGPLEKLRELADRHANWFESLAFRNFFREVHLNVTDEYLAIVKQHLAAMSFRRGVWINAELGAGNQGSNFILLTPPARPAFWKRWRSRDSKSFTYQIPERDEAGARALSHLHDQGVKPVALAAAQSAVHLWNYFAALHAELAFYVGCMNLHRTFSKAGIPVCLPSPHPPQSRRHKAVGLRDAGLAMQQGAAVVGNDFDADGKSLVLITGANQGGKSTFLRSVGLAQLMMQCGLFVAAESFEADLCTGLFTHFKQSEDATMRSGKFDEELARMSRMVDAMTPGALVLFNESFAATHDREGSAIAGQIVRALRESGIKVFFVTHLHQFARDVRGGNKDGVLFLRADRADNGQRSYRLRPGEPLDTSFGTDLYREIFGVMADPVRVQDPELAMDKDARGRQGCVRQ